MTRRDFVNRLPCVLLRLVSHMFLCIGLVLSFLILSSPTQAASSITQTTGAGALGTNVTQTGNVYGITGGKPVGTNLFHSFSQFSVGTGDIAQFQTTSLIPNSTMNNVLARVTGNNPSAIFGTIDSATYYPKANFFLMNPNGILFGPNATVNVGGMAHFTTADYLKLADGHLFKAMPDVVADPLLSTYPVTAFGFLGSNPAAIVVQGSMLTVQPGQAISLVGGNQGFTYTNPDTDAASSVPNGMTMTGGRLSAPSGQINIASVASAGEISTGDFMPTSGMTMGNIALSQGAILDVSGQGGGTVRIRGGQFVMDSASLTANSTGNATGAATAISIQLAGDMTLSNQSLIAARSLGAGTSGNVEVSASNIQVTGGSQILTGSSTTGIAGDITLTAEGTLTIAGTNNTGSPSSVQTQGPSGAITISASDVKLDDRAVIKSSASNAGGAGDITLTTNNLTITNGGGIVTSGGESSPSGNIHITATNDISLLGQFDLSNLSRIANENGGSGGTGNIVVETKDLLLSGGGRILSDTTFSPVPPGGPKISVSASGSVTIQHGSDILVRNFLSDVGALELSAKTLTMTDRGQINTFTFDVGNAGAITVTADDIALSGGSQISSSSLGGAGKAGPVTVTANNKLSLTGQGIDDDGNVAPSGIFSTTRADFPDPSFTGDAGTITIAAKTLEVSNGARIDSSSMGYALGNAGQIMVSAPTILVNAGSISTSTEYSGNAGAIQINTGSLTVNQGGRITSSSVVRTVPLFDGEEIPPPTGSAGTITVQGLASPAQSVLIDGPSSGIFTTTSGTGAGGNITLNANTFTLQNGGTLSAATSGTDVSATGGTITVTAGQVNLTNGGLITASTTGAGTGGSITIGAGSTFASNASTVSSTATQAQGGDITITAGQSATLNNGSLITASSTGPGNAGNILINAGQNYTSTDSAVTTQAAQASGGNITLLATGTVQLTNSQLNASVQGFSTTVGGNITIDPQYVILLNSQILAQATQGQGGAISINITNGGLYLPDANSTVSASSQFGVDGIVTIQSPNAPAGGKIIPLSQKPLLATSLLNQRCASLAGGEFSSFTVAGRDSLPTEPGGWLASPMALSLGGTGGGTLAEKGGRAGIDDDPAREATILSLRQIAPAGFLTQSFAVEGSAGCQS